MNYFSHLAVEVDSEGGSSGGLVLIADRKLMAINNLCALCISEGSSFQAEKSSPARKKTSTCAVPALLRTRNLPKGASTPGFGSHSRRVGLQAPDILLAPSGYSIGSSKGPPGLEHCRGLCSRNAAAQQESTTSCTLLQGTDKMLALVDGQKPG